ncbi:RDD family protein [Kitasatospora sp. NPDC001574]
MAEITGPPQHQPGAWWTPGHVPSPRRPARAPAIPGLADWTDRATAAAVELGIAGGLMATYTALLHLASPVFALGQLAALLAGIDVRGALASLYWAAGAAWLVVQWTVRGRTGQSLGQRLVGIVVVDQDTGAPIGPARSILRSLLHTLDTLPLGAGYVRPVVHHQRQTWADTISRTVVVRMDLINTIAAPR